MCKKGHFWIKDTSLGSGLKVKGTMKTAKLTDNVVTSFRVAKIFRENNDMINAMDYAPNGEELISSSDDDSVVIYDCLEGKYDFNT